MVPAIPRGARVAPGPYASCVVCSSVGRFRPPMPPGRYVTLVVSSWSQSGYAHPDRGMARPHHALDHGLKLGFQPVLGLFLELHLVIGVKRQIPAAAQQSPCAL